MGDSARGQVYREQAKRLHRKAAQMNSPEIRQAMEEIAARYERLAEAAEPEKRSVLKKLLPETGRGVLERVIREFPNSPQALVARRRIRLMGYSQVSGQ